MQFLHVHFMFQAGIKACDVAIQTKATEWTVLSCGAVYDAIQGGSSFCVCRWNPEVWSFK